MFGKNGIVVLEFESGQNLTFLVPANQSGLLTGLVRDKPLHWENIKLVFGDLMNRSAYDQYAALLISTPRTVRAFGPRAEAARGVTLLMIKAIAFPAALETGALSFQFSDKQGFQIGDPRKSKRVDFKIFGKGDHFAEISCSNSKDGIWFSQSELNRILTSLHPVATEFSTQPEADTAALHN